MTKSRWAATGLLSLAFALGGLVGGTATMLADRDHRPTDTKGLDRAAYKAQMRQEYIERLRADVGLSTSDVQGVIEVLDQHEPVMDSLWRSLRTQFDTERQAVRRDIRARLDPDQQLKYDAFNAKRDSVHRARDGARD